MKRFVTHYLQMVWVLGISICLTGCAVKSIPFIGSGPLPEVVYKAPEKNEYREATVGVFRFTTGAHPVDLGMTAANSLYQKLLKKKAFAEVVLMTELKNTSFQQQLAAARQRGLSLIITGTILYYMDGSRSQPSQVEQEIKAFDVTTQNIIWYAKTNQSDSPSLEKDRILYQTPGAPARPVRELMDESLERMANLFLD